MIGQPRKGRPGFQASVISTALGGLLLLTLGCASAEQRWRSARLLADPSSSRAFRYSELVDIHYEEVGAGRRTVVFLHGFGSSSRNWDDLRDLLDPKDLRLVFLDLKGFGLSSRPRDNDYSLLTQAAIVQAFIESEGYESVVLIGHSYGGAVALGTTLLLEEAGRGDLVRGLVLIDSAAYFRKLPLFIDLLRTPVLGQLATWLLPRRLQLRIMVKKAYFDDRTLTPETLERYVAFYRIPGSRYSLRKVARQAVPKNHADLEKRYLKPGVPAHLLWGRRDRMIPVDKIGKRLATDLRAKSFEILEDCGHIPQEERPAATAAILARFLADLHGDGASSSPVLGSAREPGLQGGRRWESWSAGG